MDRKHEIRKELEQIAPKLSELNEHNDGFKVPENYFGQMQEAVMERIKSDTNLEVIHPQPTGILKILQPRILLRVAGFALVIAMAAYFLLPGGNGDSSAYLAELSPEEASEYVQNNLDEFDLDDMLEVAQLDPTELFSSETLLLEEVQEKDMEQYIDDIIDDFDLEELEELL